MHKSGGKKLEYFDPNSLGIFSVAPNTYSFVIGGNKYDHVYTRTQALSDKSQSYNIYSCVRGCNFQICERISDQNYRFCGSVHSCQPTIMQDEELATIPMDLNHIPLPIDFSKIVPPSSFPSQVKNTVKKPFSHSQKKARGISQLRNKLMAIQDLQSKAVATPKHKHSHKKEYSPKSKLSIYIDQGKKGSKNLVHRIENRARNIILEYRFVYHDNLNQYIRYCCRNRKKKKCNVVIYERKSDGHCSIRGTHTCSPSIREIEHKKKKPVKIKRENRNQPIPPPRRILGMGQKPNIPSHFSLPLPPQNQRNPHNRSILQKNQVFNNNNFISNKITRNHKSMISPPPPIPPPHQYPSIGNNNNNNNNPHLILRNPISNNPDKIRIKSEPNAFFNNSIPQPPNLNNNLIQPVNQNPNKLGICGVFPNQVYQGGSVIRIFLHFPKDFPSPSKDDIEVILSSSNQNKFQVLLSNTSRNNNNISFFSIVYVLGMGEGFAGGKEFGFGLSNFEVGVLLPFPFSFPNGEINIMMRIKNPNPNQKDSVVLKFQNAFIFRKNGIIYGNNNNNNNNNNNSNVPNFNLRKTKKRKISELYSDISGNGFDPSMDLFDRIPPPNLIPPSSFSLPSQQNRKGIMNPESVLSFKSEEKVEEEEEEEEYIRNDDVDFDLDDFDFDFGNDMMLEPPQLDGITSLEDEVSPLPIPQPEQPQIPQFYGNTENNSDVINLVRKRRVSETGEEKLVGFLETVRFYVNRRRQ